MSRVVRAVAAVGTLAALVAVPASPAFARAKASCGPAKAHTIVANREARIFRQRGRVWGCSYDGKRSYPLAASYDCSTPRACGGLDAVKLAGEWAGVGASSSDGSTSVAVVKVVQLRTGRVLHRFREGGDDGAEKTQALIADLVVTRRGSIGWVVGVAHLPQRPDEGPSTREVHRIDDSGHALLDSGPNVRDLAYGGSTMFWLNGDEPKSAPLR
jgi:hypothetical protein